MKRKLLYGVWAVFYIICGILGHTANPEAGQAVAMTVVSVLFFVPGTVLLIDALRREDKKSLRRIRLLSIVSLALTLAALIAGIAAGTSTSETLGNVFHVILIWVSSPMVCSQHWVLSLFLWASLLFGTFLKKPKC